MSHSPLNEDQNADEYLDNWNGLANRIRNLQSLSGRERNCCFLNTGKGWFADVSAASGLHFADDGRGLAYSDWDQDGDIDIWTANRTGPRIRFLRNNLAARKNFIALKLVGKTCNRDAIGARVEIVVRDDSMRIVKTLRAGEGFLSQSTKWLHFGLGANDKIERIAVRWPGANTIESFKNVEPNQRYLLTQSSGSAICQPKRSTIQLTPSELPILMPTGAGRTFLTQRKQLELLTWRDFRGNVRDSSGIKKPILLNLWASWCPTCMSELHELHEIADSKMFVLALTVDAVEGTESREQVADLSKAEKVAASLSKIETGVASQDLLKGLTELHNEVIYRQRSLPLPCSFLIDENGQVAAIYKGPVTVKQLQSDVAILNGTPQQIANAAAPFGGIDVKQWLAPHPIRIATTYLEGEYYSDAKRTLSDYLLDRETKKSRDQFITAHKLLAQIARLQDDSQSEVDSILILSNLSPNSFEGQIDYVERLAALDQGASVGAIVSRLKSIDGMSADQLDRLGRLAMQVKLFGSAQRFFSSAVEKSPNSLQSRFGLAMAYQSDGKTADAIRAYNLLIQKAPDLHEASNNLAWLLATDRDLEFRDPEKAIELARKICEATDFKETSYIDTLSVAYAAAGNFEMAIKTVDREISIAEQSNDANVIEKLRQRRKKYVNNDASLE